MLRKICCLTSESTSCKFMGISRNKIIKIEYLLVLLLAFGVVALINASSNEYSAETISSYGCQSSNYPQDFHLDRSQCIKNKNAEIVYIGVAFLHFLLMCSMFCKSQKVKIINEGIWIIKVIIIALISLFLRLMVGTTFFQYLSQFSVWTANLYYLCISIVFVDLIYALDKYIDECAQENSKIYILKAILSITLLIASSFLCFISFRYNPSFVCWTNAICLFLFVIFAVLRFFPTNSIFISSMIGLCINILGFYIKDSSSVQDWNFSLHIIKILFVIFLLLGMLCPGSDCLRTRKSTLNELLALNTNSNEEDNRYVSSNKWTVYHYVMIIIASSIGVSICWSTKGNTEEVNQWLQINDLVWWMATITLYIWSLISSKIFPQKDFSDLENYFRQYQLQ